MILARSPYYVISDTLTPSVTSFDIELRIWKGDKVSDKPVDPTYEFKVQRPSANTNQLSKNISPYIEDFFIQESLDPFLNSSENTIDNIVWVDWVGVHTGDAGIADVTGIDFGLNGYTEFLEGINKDDYVSIYNTNGFPQFTKKSLDTGLTILPMLRGYSYQTSDSNGTNTGVTPIASTESSEQIFYIVLDNSSFTDFIQVEITDPNNGNARISVIKIDLVCENKFHPTNIIFQNKYGAYENLYLFKKPVNSLKVESSRFISNVSDGITYDTKAHQYKKFGIQGERTLKAMTGYVPDNINETIQQMLLSQNVFIQENDTLNPVNVKTESLEYQTQLVNEKVNYEIEFEYAYNFINSM